MHGSGSPAARFGVADELSYYYDSAAEPCNLTIELSVPGHVDEPAFRLAVRAALAEHPGAMVRRAAAGWWRHAQEWEQPRHPDIDPVTLTTWADQDELDQVRERFLGLAPPLTISPPLRLLLAAGPGEDRIIVNSHHAAFDGISCIALIRSVSRHYLARISAEPAQGAAAADAQPPAGLAAVRQAPARPAVAPGSGQSPTRSGRPARPKLPGVLPRPAARIAADVRSRGPRGGRPGYGFRLLLFPVPTVPRNGQGPHATVNDLLIAAMVVAIGRWNASRGRARGRIRITMPVNSRPPGQEAADGNVSRLAAVTASQPPDGGGFESLLASVAAQTRQAKNHAGPVVDPLNSALAAAPFPWPVKRLLLRVALRTAGSLLCDTCMFSNLGVVADPPRFGQAAAASMWISGPAHMPRGLSAVAVTTGGQLHLCLRYRHALFSEAAAASFAAAYAAALSDVAGDTSPLLEPDHD
jgi:NRPS condensation-like uncharacterized protein